ncbi:MAG: iron ABC transporter permease, partial [Papillibacter sp.]|nr:iron ABC transporter permease [Papillibacter sp.]
RLIAAAVLGGALSVSGFLLQTFFRNPIAGPFVLGISSGAKMVLGLVMIFLLKYIQPVPVWLTMVSAFIGSLLTLMLVLLFAKKMASMSMLLVVGIMIGYICSAVTDFCITFASDADITNLTHWSQGSFSSISWQSLLYASVIIGIAFLLTFLLSKPLGAYQLGEGYAKSLGLNIKRFRIVIILLSSLLSATVTALSGPISFVGIAVPHITRIMLKSTKPIIMVPAAFLCGSVFCMFCDLIARTLFSPTELAIGTVTAAFGAPIVIWLMVSNKKKGGSAS